MSRYLIPEVFKSGFTLISRLSNSNAQLIKEELNSTDYGQNFERIVDSLFTKLELDSKDLRLVIRTIFNILNFKEDEEDEDVVNDLLESIEEQINDIEKKDLENLKVNLKTFMEVGGSTLETVKGHQILRQNEKNFVGSKIISDVRIVFDDDLDDKKIKNAVIVHNLNIRFEEAGDINGIFFALDSSDLNKLKEAIERAQKKELIIRNDKALDNLSFLNIDKE